MGTWISAEPTKSDLIHKRGDKATLVFTHTFGASGNIAAARFFVRQAVDGTLVYSLTLADDAAQWDFTVSDQGTITILPADTDGLEDGDWLYDIELTHTDNTVTTFQEGSYWLSGDISA